MNKQAFLDTLHQLLASLPTEERLAAVKYYEEYFEEAGPGQEEAILAELGDPQGIADALLRDYSGVPGTARQVAEDQAKAAAQDRQHTGEAPKSGYNTAASGYSGPYSGGPEQQPQGEQPWYKRIPVWAWVIMGVFLIPVASALVGVIGAVLSALFTMILAVGILLFAVTIVGVALCVAGLACVVAGCLAMGLSVASGILAIGIGLVLMAIGLGVTALGIKINARWLPRAFAWLGELCRRIIGVFKKRGTAV